MPEKAAVTYRLATQSGEVFPPGALPSNAMIVDSVASLQLFFVLFPRQNNQRVFLGEHIMGQGCWRAGTNF